METLEQLKAIRDNAPDDCAGIISEGQYFLNSDFVTVDNGFIDIDGADLYSGEVESFEFRSLSDINRIIEQREMLEIAWGVIQEAGYEDFCSELRSYIEDEL